MNGSLLLSINYCIIKVYAYVFRIIFSLFSSSIMCRFHLSFVYIPIRANRLLVGFSSFYYYDHNSFHFSFNSTFLYSFCQVCSFNPVYCNRDLNPGLISHFWHRLDFTLLSILDSTLISHTSINYFNIQTSHVQTCRSFYLFICLIYQLIQHSLAVGVWLQLSVHARRMALRNIANCCHHYWFVV